MSIQDDNLIHQGMVSMVSALTIPYHHYTAMYMPVPLGHEGPPPPQPHPSGNPTVD